MGEELPTTLVSIPGSPVAGPTLGSPPPKAEPDPVLTLVPAVLDHGFTVATGSTSIYAPWQARDSWGLIGLAVLVAGWLIAAAWVGAPLIGRPWSPWGLVPLAGAALAGIAIRSKLAVRERGPRWARAMAIGCALLLLAAFGYGLNHSVVIRGHVYLSTSREARSHHLVEDLQADRAVFTQIDSLLALDPSTARTRYLELKPAQLKMEAIAARWNQTEAGDLPDGRFMPAVEHVRAAAYFGGMALERKQSLLGVQDSQVGAELDQYRGALVSNALSLTTELRPLARRYGISGPHMGRK